MTDNGKGTEITKLQSQNKQLESTVSAYRQRLKDLVEILPKSDLDRLLLRHGLRDILEVPQQNGLDNHVASMNGSKTPDLGIDVSTPNNDDQLLIETSPKHFAPLVPPRNIQNQINSTLEALKPSVGTKLEGLLLNSDSDSDFDPRADECETNSSSTTASLNGNGNKISNDFFGFEPPKTMGQHLFTHPVNHTNGVNGTMNGHQVSPPPLLAPPPKASIPRRSTPSQINNNNSNVINNNSSQDLFGSTPFNAMQTNSFEATIGYGAFNLSSSSFETIPNSSITTGEANPFNKSGTNFNDTTTSINSSGLSTISSTSMDAFDSSFNQSSMSYEMPNPFMAINQSTNPSITESNGIGYASQVNPFAMSDGLMMNGGLESNGHGKYDAFRSSTLEMNRVETGEEIGEIKTVDLDLFKDAAAAAFSEFGKSKHDYTNNKLTETNVNGKNNFNKSIGFSADDFTLESLDPLRK
ncbi:hypothetical protein HA402_000549 [Bradysia odoriphaga]|nr:hypothetical protein HA402_000549 [Bradysia odoriphaga]